MIQYNATVQVDVDTFFKAIIKMAVVPSTTERKYKAITILFGFLTPSRARTTTIDTKVKNNTNPDNPMNIFPTIGAVSEMSVRN